jgi:hypothetical protein
VASHRNAESALRKVMVSLQRSTVVEGVNMTYLRNVVLKYLTFRPESLERLRLVPVLASMLNLSKRELSRVEGASRSMVKQWWKTAGELRQEALRQDRKRKEGGTAGGSGGTSTVAASSGGTSSGGEAASSPAAAAAESVAAAPSAAAVVGMGFLRSPAQRGSAESMERARRQRRELHAQVRQKEELAVELPGGADVEDEAADVGSLLRPMA